MVRWCTLDLLIKLYSSGFIIQKTTWLNMGIVKKDGAVIKIT